MRIQPWLLLAGLGMLAAHAEEIAGDSQRGEKLFTSERCIQCHSINGKGGKIAPDLGKVIDRSFTPARMVGLMWNHAPAMWSTMRNRGVERPVLSAENAADLFAYFYSIRFFDKPGDAARGKEVFSARRCADCHGITNSKAEGAPAVTSWESLGHPIILVQQMWNHSGRMREALARRKIVWPQLSTQDLSDILVYLRNLPETKLLPSRFYYYVEPATGGNEVFKEKSCERCHTGKLALENRLQHQTLTDIAVDMWNHAPKMIQPPPQFTQDDMRKLVSYLWVRQFFRSGGTSARGQKVFTGKRCIACHGDRTSGAPDLSARKDHTAITMVAALWQHGPQMLERMKQKGIEWPHFDGNQMADLIAFLSAGVPPQR